MKTKLGKYVFRSKEEAETYLNNLPTENEHTVIHLGPDKLTEGIYEEDEETLITPAAMASNWKLDVYWVNLPDNSGHPYGFEDKAIKINGTAEHRLLGSSTIKILNT